MRKALPGKHFPYRRISEYYLRVTYVADEKGIIRMVFRSQMRATEHVERALEFIRNSSGKQQV
jgi:peroxiredoxin